MVQWLDAQALTASAVLTLDVILRGIAKIVKNVLEIGYRITEMHAVVAGTLLTSAVTSKDVIQIRTVAKIVKNVLEIGYRMAAPTTIITEMHAVLVSESTRKHVLIIVFVEIKINVSIRSDSGTPVKYALETLKIITVFNLTIAKTEIIFPTTHRKIFLQDHLDRPIKFSVVELTSKS
jgi:hypothetical protein